MSASPWRRLSYVGSIDFRPPGGHGELARPAETFDACAARLREFRRTNQAELPRAQQTTELAVNAPPYAVALVAPDGTVDLANDTARRLFRLYPGLRLSAAPVAKLDPQRQPAPCERCPAEADGDAGAVRDSDPPDNGSERFFLPPALPISEGEGRGKGVVIVLADVTHLRKLDEVKSGLCGVASH